MTLSLIATIFAIDAPSKNVLPPFADNSVKTSSVIVTQKPFVYQKVTQSPFVYKPAVQIITQKPFVYKTYTQKPVVQNPYAYQAYKAVTTKKPFVYKPTVQAYRPAPFATQKPFVYNVQKPYKPVVSQQAYAYRPQSSSQGDNGSYRPSGDNGSYDSSKYQ